MSLNNIKYDFLGSFKHGFALFLFNGKLGVIDENYNIIIPAMYDKITPLKGLGFKVEHFHSTDDTDFDPKTSGYLEIQDTYQGIISYTGDIILKTIYYNIKRQDNGNYIFRSHTNSGLLSHDGEILLDGHFENIRYSDLTGYIKFDSKSNTCGYADSNGDIVIEVEGRGKNIKKICFNNKPNFVYEKDHITFILNENKTRLFQTNSRLKDVSVRNYNGNSYLVTINDGDTSEIYDAEFKSLYKGCFDSIDFFGDNCFIIKKGKSASLINKFGCSIHSTKNINHSKDSSNILYCYDKNNLCYLINENGDLLSDKHNGIGELYEESFGQCRKIYSTYDVIGFIDDKFKEYYFENISSIKSNILDTIKYVEYNGIIVVQASMSGHSKFIGTLSHFEFRLLTEFHINKKDIIFKIVKHLKSLQSVSE